MHGTKGRAVHEPPVQQPVEQALSAPSSSSVRGDGRSGFGWFGLRRRAVDSRLAAAAGLLLTFFVLGLAYGPVNLVSEARGITVFDPAQLFVFGGRSLDSRVPYLPWTLLVYLAYNLFFLVPLVTYPKTEAGARELFRLYGALVLVVLAACVVFVVSPAEMTLRAEHPGDATFFERMNQALRGVDPPFNTWPSLHVALPCLTLLAVARWVRKRWLVLLWPFWVVVSLSTLTVKQHFVWDVVTGALLGLTGWYGIVRKRPARS